MKCYKCGKETDLKKGLCIDCYKEVLNKRYAKNKNKSKNDPNYIMNHLTKDEKIISKMQTSNIIYVCIIVLFAISVILFPKTILEFFWKKNNFYFPVLIANIVMCFIGIYSVLYFLSREIYLTNKRIIGKWGIFNIKFLDAPLNKIESIDTFKIKAVEIAVYGKSYIFDFVANSEKFRLSTINQVKIIIDSTTDEHVLMSFNHSLNEKLEEYRLKEEHPNMTYCRCCGEMISKESSFCVHCGQPLPENERESDWILKIFCFVLSPLGFLIFLLNVGEHPKLANQCLIASLLGLFVILTIYLSVASVLSML